MLKLYEDFGLKVKQYNMNQKVEFIKTKKIWFKFRLD